MLRQYLFKNKPKLYGIQSLIKKLPNVSSHTFHFNGIVKQYFNNDFPQLLKYQEEVLDSLPNHLYKDSLDLQLIIVEGTIDSHRDSESKQFILIPIKCNKSTILWEENRSLIIEPFKIYTINDFNYHGLITKTDATKTIFIALS
jgi:hypothetical protein